MISIRKHGHLKIYVLAIGIALIVLGFVLFKGFRSFQYGTGLGEDRSDWVKVEATLVNVQENWHRRRDDEGTTRTEIEYIGDYAGEFNGETVTLQRVVNRKQNLKETHIFYVKPSKYHGGFDAAVPEVPKQAEMFPYLFLLMPLTGTLLIVSSLKRTRR